MGKQESNKREVKVLCCISDEGREKEGNRSERKKGGGMGFIGCGCREVWDFQRTIR